MLPALDANILTKQNKADVSEEANAKRYKRLVDVIYEYNLEELRQQIDQAISAGFFSVVYTICPFTDSAKGFSVSDYMHLLREEEENNLHARLVSDIREKIDCYMTYLGYSVLGDGFWSQNDELWILWGKTGEEENQDD